MKNLETTEGSCEHLQWDSGFFGFKIGRLNADSLTPALVSAADAWCLANDIRCIYFLASADDAGTSTLAGETGFLLVDIRMTFEIVPVKPTHPTSLRPAVPRDYARLGALAGANSGESRFCFDKNFPQDAATRLYERWMERSCEGSMATKVFVAGDIGEPVGYVTCVIEPGGDCGNIGLLGLAPEARGRGLGQLMLAHALGWFASQGCGRVTVVTQGRNIAAQRLYQRGGFLIRKVQLSYHKWLSPKS